MDTKKPCLMEAGHTDEMQTPPHAIIPLIPILDKRLKIWECAEGQGYLTNALRLEGYNVIGTSEDFFTIEPPEYDCIVTNPPYKKKDDFIEHCYSLDKPFALLMPLTALEGQRRQKLYKTWGVQLIFFNRRINFITPSGRGSGSWFATAWFTNGLHLENDINFVEVEKDDFA